MATLVVTTQGARLRCKDGEIVVEKADQVLQRLPQNQVERVLLLGGIGFTTGFLQFALQRRAPVTFLSQDGQYKGRLESGSRRDVALRLAQYRGLDDIPWRLTVAEPLVEAKIAAQRGLLLRRHRNRACPELIAVAEEMDALRHRLSMATTLPKLMGLEGHAARLYFGALPKTLLRPLPFRGRNRRPPRDPVNALLSLGYGLLTAEIVGALSGVGLDPQIGIFHSSRGRMPALAEDLLELFRAPVSDALALSLVNLGVLTESDFTSSQENGVLLSARALEVYFRHYRRRMTANFRDRTGQVTSFRHAIQTQTAHLRHVILREEPFSPFVAPLGGPVRREHPVR